MKTPSFFQAIIWGALFVPSAVWAMEDFRLPAIPLDLQTPLNMRHQGAQPQPAQAQSAAQGKKKRKKKSKKDKAPPWEIRTAPVGARGVTPQNRTIGVGVQIGFPTALTVKFMLQKDQGVIAGLGAGAGWLFTPSLSVHADYLWHPHTLVQGVPFRISWYVGGGAQVAVSEKRERPIVSGLHWYGLSSYAWIAARVPVGLNLSLNQLPIEIYLETVPTLVLFPELTFGIGATVGGRFYF